MHKRLRRWAYIQSQKVYIWSSLEYIDVVSNSTCLLSVIVSAWFPRNSVVHCFWSKSHSYLNLLLERLSWESQQVEEQACVECPRRLFVYGTPNICFVSGTEVTGSVCDPGDRADFVWGVDKLALSISRVGCLGACIYWGWKGYSRIYMWTKADVEKQCSIHGQRSD